MVGGELNMFKKGNNIFSLLIIILSVLMTSSSYIVKADNTDTGTASTAPKDWGDSLITKGQLQDLNGKPLTEFNQNQSMRAYWEFSNQKNGINQEIHDGDTMVVKVPEQLALTSSKTNDADIYANGTKTSIGVAHLNPNDRTITVKFNQNADDLSKDSALLKGSFWVDKISWNTQMDLSKEIHLIWTTNGSAASNPDTTGPVTVKPSVPDSSEVLYKYGGFDKNNIIHWTVRINYAGKEIPNAVYKDIIGPHQTLLLDTIVAHHATFDKTTGQMTEDKDPFTIHPVKNSTDGSTGFTINLGTINQSIMLDYDTQTTDDSKSSYYGNTGDLLSNSKVIENVPVNLSTNQLGGQATNSGAVTSIRGYKLWNIPNTMTKPKTVTIDLFQGTSTEPYKKAIVSEDKTTGDWYYEFNNLPKYDDNGKEISYDVKEDPKEAAALGFTGIRDYTNYNITNIPTPDKTVLKVTKIWNDNNNSANKRPHEITVGLYNGDGHGPTNYKNTATLSDDPKSNWSTEFTNLPATGISDPNWYISEDSIANYIHTSDSNNYDNPNDKVITNTLATSLTVTKKWTDSTGKDITSNDYPAIQVQLYQNDKAKNDGKDEPVGKPITLNSANDWTDTFKINEPTDSRDNPDQTTKLPVYDSDGNKITYHAEEVASSIPSGYSSNPEYSTNADGTKVTITNKQADTTNPADDTTNLNVTKIWHDDNNKDNLRPDQVTVHLFKNGIEIDKADLNKNNSWAHNFTGLDKNAKYTVTEDKVANYSTNIDNTSSTDVQITNTHTPATTTTTDNKTNLTVKKSWNDNNNQDNLRPNQVTVHLLKNGKIIDQPVTLSSLNAWSYTWNDLDKNGKYTVQEDTVAGYTTMQSDSNGVITITNTHNVTKTPDNPDKPTIPGGNNDNHDNSFTNNNGDGDSNQNKPGNGDGSNTTTNFTPDNPMVPSPIYQQNNPKNGLLPQTGAKDTNIIYSIVGLLLLGLITAFGIKRKQA